ncbi:putative choline ABC transporter, ATP-binding protein OpuBA [Limosilactobacillus coleohominis 101-4-CHN]|uniref:ABC-type quaternary amine transporter n=1 Tax=Limosilactobacillus coleohominis 101-4-CHN TaxID=575594 RepID=C7XVG8_9LACO|nr:ABC transporter ATP-binding protein [Limosilactobacillus coleohominis]EEU30334.1 putative choline ABC transporter, ATP-binding protein OpuBA [Limosilactobacillus coleohominis 101-4-CHN]
MIRYDHVAKTYSSVPVIRDVSFDIDEGDLFVLVGPSGSGKTTLLKMFNRLTVPTEGNVYYQGKKIKDYDLQQLRLQTGYVLQDSSLFPNLNLQDNIAIQLEQQGIAKTKRHQRACELLRAVDMDPEKYAQRMPNELSGGEQQRVGIIRALAAKPAVILMDEPFSALDPVVRRQLQDLVLRLQKQTKTTIIFVTHDMHEALRMGTKIAVLKDGVLQQVGTPQEIINQPATKFVKEFFYGHGFQFSLNAVLDGGLGKKVSAASDDLPVVTAKKLEELLAFCRDRQAQRFVVQTDDGQYIVNQQDVWNYLIRREENRA